MRAIGVAGRRGGRGHARRPRLRHPRLAGAGQAPIDCGNAGTVTRLIAACSPGQEGGFELVGDESLSRRPRGASRSRSADGREHQTTEGHDADRDRGPPCAGSSTSCRSRARRSSRRSCSPGSAPSGRTTVVEPPDARSHRADARAAGAGAPGAGYGQVEPGETLRLPEVLVPGDVSSAAPFLVAAALLRARRLTVHDVGINPLRAGLLDVLERMGVRVASSTGGRSPASRSATSRCRRPSSSRRVEAAEVPRLVDELPLVALLGAHRARRRRAVTGAEELRAKETDRVETVTPRCARSAAASRRGPTASSSAAFPPGRAAGRSTRPATTASRCSARSRASSRARACGSRAPSAWRSASPASSSCCHCGRDGRHPPSLTGSDRRHRRARRRRQEHGRARARRAARLPLPRHRRDVPQR